jgi:hypothetical protein
MEGTAMAYGDDLKMHYSEVRARLQNGRKPEPNPKPPVLWPLPAPKPPPDESKLDKVAAFWALHDRDLGLPKPSIDAVIHVVAAFFHVEVGALLSHRRMRPLVHSRQAVALLIHELCNKVVSTTTQIAKKLDRDHSTIIYQLHMAALRVAADPQVSNDFHVLRTYLERPFVKILEPAEAEPQPLESSEMIGEENDKTVLNVLTA